MPAVACPHCRNQVEQTRELSGIVVACPFCRQAFQMPAYEEPTAAFVPYETPKATSRSSHRLKRDRGDDTLNLVFGVLGSLMLIAGVFAPFIRVPIAGGVDYFRNGAGDGVIVLILGIATLVITLFRQHFLLWFPTVLSAGMIAFTFTNFQMKMAEVRAKMAEDLKGNPFAGLAHAMVENVSMDWGFFVLLLAIGLLLAAAAIPLRRSRAG